jgi:predicted dehydrogenase
MSVPQVRQALPPPERTHPIVSVGAGGIVSDAHLPAYRKAGFDLFGIVDLDRARAQATADRFGVEHVFSDLAEAVAAAPDGAVYDVAVPADAILGIVSALPDGAAALIQKPLGNDLAEAGAIRAMIRKKGITAAVNFQMRYVPYVLAARDLIEQGVIGELHDMEVRLKIDTPWHLWSFFETLPRVEILYHSVHYLDLFRAFLGEPRGLFAKTVGSPVHRKLASTRSTIALDYGDSVRATITTNHGHIYGPRHQESYVAWEGTEGAIRATIGLYLNYPEGGPDALEFCRLEAGRDPQWRAIPVEGTWFPDAFVGSMTSLMRFVEGSASELPTSVEDAYRTMVLVEAAHRASDAGGVPVLL